MQTSNCKLSIIVPVYNTANFLKECLDSIIAIPLEDKEVIVVNDGSTDNSLDIINEYIGNTLKVVSIENSGLSVARNIGMQYAKGEYILFVDSDDFVFPDLVAGIVKLVIENKVDFALGKSIKCSETGKLLEKINNIYKVPEIFIGHELYDNAEINDPNMIMAPLKICRRDFLVQNNIFFIKGLYHEDVLFSFLCSKYATRTMKVGIPFYVYRQRDGSIVHTPSEKKQLNKLYIADYILTNICDSDSSFWNNYAMSLYFDVLRRTRLKNCELAQKLYSVKKIRLKQIVKLILIPFLHICAQEKEFKGSVLTN